MAKDLTVGAEPGRLARASSKVQDAVESSLKESDHSAPGLDDSQSLVERPHPIMTAMTPVRINAAMPYRTVVETVLLMRLRW